MSHVSYVKQTVSLLPRHQPSSWALSSETRRVQLWDITWLHVRYDSWRCGRQGSCICGSQWVSFRTVASSSAKFVGAVIWNTTHSVVWHDFFTFEMWILQVCEIWLTHMCFSIGILPYWSLVISQVRGRCHVRHDADSCGIWTNSIIKPDFCHVWDDHQLSSWVLSVKHDILNCETWLGHIWEMTPANMRHDSIKFSCWCIYVINVASSFKKFEGAAVWDIWVTNSIYKTRTLYIWVTPHVS